MAKLTIDFHRVGPDRPAAMELPPVSMRLNGYVIDYDETIGEIVYLCGTGYEGFGESWGWNGKRWKLIQKKRIRLDGEKRYQGYYDPTRKGMVAFKFDHHYESETYRPEMLLVTKTGIKQLELEGDHPVGMPGFGDVRGVFAYDRARKVGVCLTPFGVWELDAKGRWTKSVELAKSEVTQKWKNDAGGCWDPVRERVFFWGYSPDEYVHEFYDWDGERLTRLPITGLPLEGKKLRAFHIGLFNPSAAFCGHPEHGIVLLDGEHFWAFDGKKWKAIRGNAQTKLPRMKEGRLGYDPKRKAFVLGPGYHEGDSGGREAQRVFYERIGTQWTMQGVKAEDSPVDRIYSNRHYFSCGGTSFVCDRRSLQTLGWINDEWVELVDKDAGNKVVGSDMVGNIVDMGDHALAILRKGNACVFDGRKWKKSKQSIPDFKERSDFTLTRIGQTDDLVIWGGEVKNRKSNDTFLRENGKWRKVKKASPRPKDFSHGNKDSTWVEFDAFWDTALQRVVRIGLDECFTLEGEIWKAHPAPSGYAKYAGERHYQHVPAHDPETGETLLINIQGARVCRFGLKKCEDIGPLVLPEDDLQAKSRHDRSTWASLNDDFWYDAETRWFRSLDRTDKWANYGWDLAPAFAAAAAKSPRKRAEPATPAASQSTSSPRKTAKPKPKAAVGEVGARLYVVEGASSKFWYCDAKKTQVIRRWGRLGGKVSEKKEKKTSSAAAREAATKLIAKKRNEGYVDATKLKPAALVSLATVQSRALSVGKPMKRAPAKHDISRIGGLPSGVATKDWPKKRRKPLGFLLQVETGEVLKRHAGVAVFCVTDGTATEDSGQNHAVLITKAKWKKKPASAPEGVPVLPVRKISFAKPKLEIIEERVQELAEKDPELGARFDDVQASSKVYDQVPWNKQGGPPTWVQYPDWDESWTLAAQVDFDSIHLKGEWADAGLFGVLYVFVSPDEKKAHAMWQYT